jgi:prepilin-type N-terminal cleavage/methylation domain-containing protein
MHQKQRKRGFTLVEIMIVVLVIGILAAIAIPNFLSARARAQTDSCIANLREIDDGIQEWAMASGKMAGDPVTMADISPSYVKTEPHCPFGNKTYAMTTVDVRPTCPNGGDHVLP